jgi:hypothetical protein
LNLNVLVIFLFFSCKNIFLYIHFFFWNLAVFLSFWIFSDFFYVFLYSTLFFYLIKLIWKCLIENINLLYNRRIIINLRFLSACIESWLRKLFQFIIIIYLFYSEILYRSGLRRKFIHFAFFPIYCFNEFFMDRLLMNIVIHIFFLILSQCRIKF